MHHYEQCLRELEGVLGTEATYASDLDHIGYCLFGDKWGGVFAKDQDFPIDRYCIINTHNQDQSGEHWLALGCGVLYDSFGRDLRKMIGGRMKITEPDPEQEESENNCGARCLAWLCVLDDCGIEIALTI